YGAAAPSPEEAQAAFKRVLEGGKGKGRSSDWEDFLAAFASYVTRSQEKEKQASITSKGSGPETVARQVAEHFPEVITEASRLARLDEEIPHLAGKNVGIHTMYDHLRDYMMRT